MTSKRARTGSRSSLRNTIFGPPPILEYESYADYKRLFDRLTADLKPTDIIAEGYVHDFAYWAWDLLRWRKIKICSIDAKLFNAFQWASILPPTQRLAFIGETGKVDAKRIIQITEECEKKIAALGSEVDEVLGKEEPADELSEVLAEIASMRDIAITRVFLEEFDNVERIDQRIITAERRRDAAYRGLERHQASVASGWREKIRNAEEAEFKVIEPEKFRAKRNGKSAA